MKNKNKHVGLLVCVFLFVSIFSIAQPVNIDFQTGNSSGWTIEEAGNGDSFLMTPIGTYSTSSQYSIKLPGQFEFHSVPISMFSPLGGNFFRLGDLLLGGSIRRLTQTYTVTTLSSALKVAYASVMQDGNHPCNQQPFFNFCVKDQFGNPIPNTKTYYNICNGAAAPSFSLFSTDIFYSNWETHSFDLSAYVGTSVTIEVSTAGCISTQGWHYGYGYFDAAICSAVPTPNDITINGVTSPLLQAQNNIAICGTTNATIQAPLGATGYTWTGSGITGVTTSSVSITSAGVYQLLIDKASACSPTTAVLFSVGMNPIVSVVGTPTICGNSSGVLYASGATNYTWTPYSTTSIIPIGGLSPSITISPTVNTTYTVTGESNGCIGTQTYAVVHSSATPISVSITATSKSICGAQTTTLTANGSPNYTWSPSSSLSSSSNPTVIASPTISTTYILYGINSFGCSDTSLVFINVSPDYTLSTSVVQPGICLGDNTVLLASGGASYTWSPVGSLSSATGDSVSASPIATTIYTVTSVNSGGCLKTQTQSLIVSDFNINISNTLSQPCMDSTTVLFVATNLTDTYTYAWSPVTFLSVTNTDSTQMNSSVAGSYTYSVMVTNSNGCSKTGSTFIEVINCSGTATITGGIKIYSGVSPNGDNHNDTWIIDGIEGEPNNTVIILNKWGQEVWKTEGYNNSDKVWKGINKNGEALTDGTYYYILTTSSDTYKGRVEVIR